jgi:hypothetical protein
LDYYKDPVAEKVQNVQVRVQEEEEGTDFIQEAASNL